MFVLKFLSGVFSGMLGSKEKLRKIKIMAYGARGKGLMLVIKTDIKLFFSDSPNFYCTVGDFYAIKSARGKSCHAKFFVFQSAS